MKIMKALKLDKYENSQRYVQSDGFFYKDLTGGTGEGIAAYPWYCVTLYAELEEDEDEQYPLEDILDKYLVNCTDVMEVKEVDGKRVYIFEIEGEDEEDVKQVANLVGKCVYNYEEDGFIKFKISDLLLD